MFGIAAASLIFLSAYGGMVSLAQTALFGIAGVILGNLATKGGPGGTQGPSPRPGPVGRARARDRDHDGDRPGLRRRCGAQRRDLLPDDHPHLLRDSVHPRPGDPDLRLLGIGGINRYTPGWIGDLSPIRTGSTTSPSSTPFVVLRYPYIVRTPFGIRSRAFATSRCGWPRSATTSPPPDARVRLRRFIASLAGVLYAWWNGQIAPGTSTSRRRSTPDHGRDRRARPDRGRLARCLRLHHHPELRPSTRLPLLGFGGTLFGGSFNTLIGIIFLAIVVVSPDGLMGLWGRLFDMRRRREGEMSPRRRAVHAKPRIHSA